MTAWYDFIDGVNRRLQQLETEGCTDPFFRGQGETTWKLVTSLSREQSNPKFHDNKEARLFWDFRVNGSHFLPRACSEWTVLYHMQHFGLPTRLLDWTTNFARALFFSMRHPISPSPTVFILNPYEMNAANQGGDRTLSNLHISFKQDYLSVLNSKQWPLGALAVGGDASIDRLRNQKGAFTLHGDLNCDLEIRYPAAITKHVLPVEARQDAQQFLRLAGVDEYAIYSDLDGLARKIYRDELGKSQSK